VAEVNKTKGDAMELKSIHQVMMVEMRFPSPIVPRSDMFSVSRTGAG
jgi:hypothetical protein